MSSWQRCPVRKLMSAALSPAPIGLMCAVSPVHRETGLTQNMN